MSCRSTKGGSLSTTLARLYSGLSDKRVQRLFHSLKREGKGLPPPTEEDYKIWQGRQQALIDNASVSSRERARLERLRLGTHGEYPDGPTFHAWQRIEVRARQEAVMERIGSAVDLAPPGSQADQYELGPDGRPARVWYASYGSNLNRARFLTYLEGGTPPGGRTKHVGARDRSEPTGDIPIRFDGRMHFAYASTRWDGGGVGFMDADKAGHALGRAYLITSEQFDDVVGQENGIPPSFADAIDINEVIEKGRATHRSTAVYSDLVHIGDHEGAPVLTFTGSFTSRDALLEAVKVADGDKDADRYAATNEPRGNYLRMIGSGLAEAFGMNEHEQADYLRGCGGAENWSRRELLRVLRADEPTAPPPPPPRSAGNRTPVPPLVGETLPLFHSPADRPPPKLPWTLGQGSATKAANAKTGTSGGSKPSTPQRTSTTTRDPGSPLPGRSVPTRVISSKRCPLCGNFHSMHECPLLHRENDK